MKNSTLLTSVLTLGLHTALLTGGVFAASESSKDSTPAAFDKTVKLEKVSFRVQCPNNSSLNKLTITPKGLSGGNQAITIDAEGTVSSVSIDDLNNDGFPEIYISVVSAGSGSYGSLIAYASNKNKSISPIFLPELTKEQMEGYGGHDDFAPVESVLVRNFPLYKGGDSNAKPTGKIRQIQYHLKAGEAGWKFVATKTFDFKDDAATSKKEGQAAVQFLETKWKLIEVVTKEMPKDADLSIVTITFTEDGKKVRGFSGCNRFNGTYTLTDQAVKLGPLMTTRRACPGTKGEIESAVLKALAKVDGYSISDEYQVMNLEVKGVPVLRFKEVK